MNNNRYNQLGSPNQLGSNDQFVSQNQLRSQNQPNSKDRFVNSADQFKPQDQSLSNDYVGSQTQDQSNDRYDPVADYSDPWDDQFGSHDQNLYASPVDQSGDRYDQVPDEDFSDHEEFSTQVPFSEKRYNVINELLTTEKDYLDCLEIVRDCFITPLKTNKILVEDEMEIIFINWNDLLLCTNRLYKSLKIRKKMTIKQDINIGDILCENFSQMGAYVRFCSSQLTAAGLLQNLIGQVCH